eukprot:RCo006494
MPAPNIRRAVASEREAVRAFYMINHLDATSFSPEALHAQIQDLPSDFPALLDDHGFSSVLCWVGIPTTEQLLASSFSSPADSPTFWLMPGSGSGHFHKLP